MCLAAAWTSARADLVIFTDGFTLEGKVQKEGKYIYDPSRQEIWMPDSGFVLDDGARRVFFSHRLVAEAQTNPEGAEPPETFQLKQPVVHYPGSPMIRGATLVRSSPWDATGKRVAEVQVKLGTLKLEQFITRVTPTFVRVETKSYHWTFSMRPQEFDPPVLLEVLRTHLQTRPAAATAPVPAADIHHRLFRFCVQVGWYEHAQAELKALLALRPEGEAELSRQVADLQRLQSRRLDDDLHMAVAAGQHARVQQLLASAPEEHTAEPVLARWRQWRMRYRTQLAQMEQARQLLAQAKREAADGAFVSRLQNLWTEIEQGLNHDTLERLEPFCRLAVQEQRRREQGEPAEITPERLLALAATGWMLGPRGAESTTAFAIKAYQGRQFLLQYLLTDAAEQRARLQAEYQSGQPLRVDELAQLIEHLPPPRLQALSLQAPAQAEELATSPTPHWPNGVKYQLFLPPEYHHHRPYPLLLLLPGLTPLTEDELRAWRTEAARWGWMLASPSWAKPDQTQYQYERREHEAVLATLQDLRRRYQVDSERVALAGTDIAGTMVYDVALSHPDVFAAAVVCCARVGQHSRILQNNAQYLPFFIIGGERDFDRPRETRLVFNYWLQRGFPSIYVEYTGRGLEPYLAELPTIFDWLQRRKRASGLPELGRGDVTGTGKLGQEFRVFRNEDNRFYWITSSEVSADPNNPALLTARQVGGNAFVVNVQRMGQVSVWLHSRMVDFENPISIRVNPGAPLSPTFQGKVQPRLDVMLEDFWQRGDKRNLFMARVDFNLRR